MIDVVIPTWDSERAPVLGDRLIEHAASLKNCSVYWVGRKPEAPSREWLLPYMLKAGLARIQSPSPYVLFLHDDVELAEDKNHFWDVATLEAFDDPKIGLVGWGGATGLGHKDLYKVSYRLEDLARENYFSATTDWKEHGELLRAPREVAVLDGFALAFRREAYEEMGGWQKAIDLGLVFHAYDLWAALTMRRLGWKIMAVPVSCRHLGGRTSTTPEYQELLKSLGYQDDFEVHRRAHEIIFREFRDVLPVRV
jgi:hypothetical protein